ITIDILFTIAVSFYNAPLGDFQQFSYDCTEFKANRDNLPPQPIFRDKMSPFVIFYWFCPAFPLGEQCAFLCAFRLIGHHFPRIVRQTAAQQQEGGTADPLIPNPMEPPPLYKSFYGMASQNSRILNAKCCHPRTTAVSHLPADSSCPVKLLPGPSFCSIISLPDTAPSTGSPE
ncbi:MAG: hypothetical protein LUG17_06280, partial [Clostridiales bacterium]|nr:hypothetical protein [Clostridiales bacterium]